jgi:putative transposase
LIELKKNPRKSQEINLDELMMFPLDSTLVTLTSQLLWSQGFHQVKLFSGLNLSTGEPGGILIHFGQGHDSKYGTGKEQVEVRVVTFSDPTEKTEFRLATNLPITGKLGISNLEIGDFYRLRWPIELLWKFLKMQLKLERLITKNVNGIEIKI